MTNLDCSPPDTGAPGVPTEDLDALAADTVARAAADAADVTIRQVSGLAEIEQVCQLVEGVWRTEPGRPLVTPELLRALTKAGNYVGAAFRGSVPVGVGVGFFTPPAEQTLHSHLTGVSTAGRTRHVGFALKLDQRAWALRHGATEIGWTFDPLVSRNAYFNLAKLAATADEYLPDFYGVMHDDLNGADASDRLHVRWHLNAPSVVLACGGLPDGRDAEAERRHGAEIALGRGPGGAPSTPSAAPRASRVLVAVPEDIETMRTRDPGLAGEWRRALRETLAPLLTGGGRVAGFDRSGWYVVRPAGSPR
ncbi:GNAT family N-acetyltransferase [Catenuloplanes atrovinosus]|uniref:GNAT superfamily acetyltransferase n=1 Tax=Catenuloplanes atrovinosus TaxID=137266 RepID=A0AAE4CAP7_9ACTN|nr:GNAT family N-acetyltransferase [Catenuloplanes atrovinosus]MDR7277273.1 putative GNAT superfamily acetyltransferase [Catenuloplanes atrovinosus]